MLALLPGLLTLLLAAASTAQASSPATANGVLSNRHLYTPRKRLTADVPGVNPNVTYVNQYSKPHTTGLIDDVAWDRYSLYVKGQRLYIWSGEFHYWRLPVVDLWRDLLQKAKAAGNNAISIYVPWHMTNPSEGVIDLTGIRNLQAFFDIAKEVGIWILARPGPFANAETTGGGIPGWVIRRKGDMRTNATDYFDAWQLYWDEITQLVAQNQISQGGPVVTFQLENEFDTGVNYSPHMEELKESARRNGITVPLTHNNPRGRGHWSFGQGAVDIAAVDAYPAGFSCAKGNSSFPAIVDAFVGWSDRVNRDAPYHFAEIQGGSFDPWGGDGGYDQCREMTGPDFDRVQYRYLLEARVTIISKYMWYGGTNWGGIAAPVVYTSYDYGTYVQESRQLPEKYHEHKLLGLFLRNAPDIRQTEVVGQFGEFSEYSFKRQPYIGRPTQNGTFYTPEDGGLWTTELRNPDTLAAFYIVRQAKWATNITAEFTRSSTLDIWTPETGDLNVPQYGSQLVIGGRDSRIIVADLTFGSTTLRYSTAEVLLSAALDDEHDILILYGTPGRNETFEVVFAGLGSAQVQGGEQGSTNATTWDVNGDLVLTFQIPSASTYASMQVGSTTVLILDHASAYKVWQPTLATDDSEWSAYAEIGTNSSAVVIGPHLVRNGSVEDGGQLALFGDTDKETMATIFAPSSISSVTWNGADVSFNVTEFGMLVTLPGPDVSNATAPTFSDWAWADSLPEASPDYDDAAWVVADHTSTNATTLPLNGSVALVATDYGFVTGTILWRGKFNATGDTTGLYLNVTGGTGFAFSAYLNGVFLGFNESIHGLTDTAFKTLQVDFPAGALSTNGSENVVLVIQDHMGLDQDTELDKKSKNLRGISEVRLLGSTSTPPLTFTQWRVQGNHGGEVDFPDRVRGSLNEGGLHGERMGWHLPGFDDSAWNSSMAAPALDGPGVRFFRSTLDLAIPEGHDVGMSFDFGKLGGHHRVFLYVNGWQMGRMAASVGPQLLFPVHPGILVSGENTIALAVWSYDDANATSIDLSFKVDWLVRGGVGHVHSDNPGWEPRN